MKRSISIWFQAYTQLSKGLSNSFLWLIKYEIWKVYKILCNPKQFMSCSNTVNAWYFKHVKRKQKSYNGFISSRLSDIIIGLKMYLLQFPSSSKSFYFMRSIKMIWTMNNSCISLTFFTIWSFMSCYAHFGIWRH